MAVVGVASGGGDREAQGLLFLFLVLVAVRVRQVGAEHDAAAARPGLEGARDGAEQVLAHVVVRGVVGLVVSDVVADDVESVKSGRFGQAPLAF